MVNIQRISVVKFKEVLLTASVFAAANLFTSLWHEMGHALCVCAFNLKGIMYHNAVWYNTDEVSIDKQALITMAGTFASFAELFISFIVLRFGKVENRLTKMYIVWLLFWSMIQVLGYVIIGAFPFPNDFSILYNLYHIPFYIRILVAIGAIIVLRKCLTVLNPYFSHTMNIALGSKNTLVTIYFIIVPLCATLIIVLANLPAKSFASIIYPSLTWLYGIPNYKSIKQNTGLRFLYSKVEQGQIVLSTLLFFILLVLFRLATIGIKI